MPKFKSYEQKFRKEWLNDDSLKDWIMEGLNPILAAQNN